MAINFFQEEVDFKLSNRSKRKKWLKEIASSESHKIGEVNYIFCSDEYLYRMNLEYLNHDTYTDVITFDNSEKEEVIEGDIFISLERVHENALTLQKTIDNELNRVMCHGLLHLLGYKDKSQEESLIMRRKEEESIQLFENL